MKWTRKKKAYRLYSGNKQIRVRKSEDPQVLKTPWELCICDDLGHWTKPKLFESKEEAMSYGLDFFKV